MCTLLTCPQTPENLKRHPWGKVPSVVFPDGFTLYESRTISKYLANKYKFPLLPSESDIEATALFDQAQSVESSYFADPAGKIGFEKFVKKFMGLPPNEDVIAEALKGLEAFFDVAEGLLQLNEYAAGKNFTLVDIYYIPLIQRLFACGYGELITSRKAVNAWWERIVSRPAIAQLLKADREAMAAMAAARK
jgi:glutathione S-transferase